MTREEEESDGRVGLEEIDETGDVVKQKFRK